MNTVRRSNTFARSGAAFLLLFGGFAVAGHAQKPTPGRHPLYIHALSDLRTARAYLNSLDERNVENDESHAIGRIDHAIDELKHASVDDGKNLNDHPPIDVNLSHRDRLNRARVLIGAAHNDVTKPEDDRQAIPWRNRAVGDINAAYRYTENAIRDDYRDDHKPVRGSHPHYVKAIVDMRAARGLLNHPDEGNVVRDEKSAIGFINGAMRQAYKAAITDGQDIYANPRPDNNLPRHDRLAQALRLLQDAHYNLTNFREGNDNTLNLLANAVTTLDRAIAQTQKAITDDRNDDNRQRGF